MDVADDAQTRVIHALSPKAAASMYLLVVDASVDRSHRVLITDSDDHLHTFRMEATVEWIAK